MDFNRIPIANPVAVLREEFDDWAVIFNPDNAEAAGINPVGVMVWKLIDGSRDVKNIIAEVQSSFAEEPETIASDVEVFLGALEEKGFVGYEASTK